MQGRQVNWSHQIELVEGVENTDFKLNSVQNWALLTAISAELQLINIIALIKILSCRGELFEL